MCHHFTNAFWRSSWSLIPEWTRFPPWIMICTEIIVMGRITVLSHISGQTRDWLNSEGKMALQNPRGRQHRCRTTVILLIWDYPIFCCSCMYRTGNVTAGTWHCTVFWNWSKIPIESSVTAIQNMIGLAVYNQLEFFGKTARHLKREFDFLQCSCS